MKHDDKIFLLLPFHLFSLGTCRALSIPLVNISATMEETESYYQAVIGELSSGDEWLAGEKTWHRCTVLESQATNGLVGLLMTSVAKPHAYAILNFCGLHLANSSLAPLSWLIPIS